jgi:3',5'-cyclic AMP phosphodiesterase CpdA
MENNGAPEMITRYPYLFSKIVLVSGLLFGMAGCPAPQIYRYLHDPDIQALLERQPATYPDLRFNSISDIHLYSTELGEGGEAFEEYLDHDRKMLLESEEILAEMCTRIIAEEPGFLLVCGDLTKDGEAVNHRLAAQYLAQVEDAGIPVYAVPGNHDLNNPDAERFDGPDTFSVESFSPAQFRTLYRDFGYDEALYEDPHSLSYVAEPVENLWLLCLDSTDSDENQNLGYPRVGGSFSALTLAWIEERLIEAAMEGKAVMAMMHHGAVPHWDGQERFHPEYLLDQYAEVARMFAAYHVRCVFTGHYHSLDVARRTFRNSGFLYDIMTPSCVTYPSVFREITVSANSMHVSTNALDAIPSIPEGFIQYSKDFTFEGVAGIAENTLIQDYGVPEKDALKVAVQVASAFIAHYGGDEDPGNQKIIDRKGLGFMGQLVLTFQRYVIEGLWQDSDGADTAITIDLNSGEWYPG